MCFLGVRAAVRRMEAAVLGVVAGRCMAAIAVTL